MNRFLFFHPDSLPEHGFEQDAASFLDHLPGERKVSGATQAQVLNAVVFFFVRVLELPLGEIGSFKRPK
ncbi:MAG: phage integrase N-terminal SAM-like domain-containing protein [Sedimenticola sp.]